MTTMIMSLGGGPMQPGPPAAPPPPPPPTSSLLPSLVTRYGDYTKILPILKEIEGRVLRLKLQTFIVCIIDALKKEPQVLRIRIENMADDYEDGKLKIELDTQDTDEADDTDEAEVAEGDYKWGENRRLSQDAGDLAARLGQLGLPNSVIHRLSEASPLPREGLSQALQEVYEDLLEPSQRKGVAEWSHYWNTLNPEL